MSVHYNPADGWLAVVSAQRAVLAPRSAIDGRLDQVHSALRAPDAVAALLELLLADGLASMPAFGYVESDGDGVRALVRGGVTATLDTTEVRGSHYSTWGEHRDAGVTRVELRAVDAAPSDLRLPLVDGAAFAGALELDVADATSRAHAPQWAGAAAPAATGDADSVDSAVIAAPNASEEPAPSPVRPEQPTKQVPTAEPEFPPAVPASAHANRNSAPEQTIAEFTMADADPGYGHLFEETIVRPIEHAAVREAEVDEEPQPTVADEALGEHDGMTIVSGELKKLREAAGSQPAPAGPAAAPAPTSRGGAELRFSNGMVEQLAGPVVIGRSPSSGKVSSGRVPRLITIPDDPDLSRSHLQIDLEGDTVVVTDLHSRNGSSIVLPGRAPERLRGGVPATVIDGTVIDLGGGCTIEVRESGADRS